MYYDSLLQVDCSEPSAFESRFPFAYAWRGCRQSPDFQRNQGTEFLGRFFLKVGRFDILLMKCHILDDFSFDLTKICQKC